MKLILKFVVCVALALTLEVIPSYAKAVSEPISEDDKLAADSTMMMSNKFTKNWEFTAMLGAQSYQAEYSQFSMNIYRLKDSWRIAGDLSLVKWASPYFGIGVGFTEAGYSGEYSPKDVRTTYAKPGDPWYQGFENRYLVASGSYGNLYAKAVYESLVNDFGVNPDQLEYDGNGGVDLMYYDDVKCSRCAIITMKK